MVGGERRIYDVQALKLGGGSAGIAIDASEATALRAALTRMAEAHRRTSINCPPAWRCSTPSGGWPSTTNPIAACGASISAFLDSNPDDSERARPAARRRANCRSSRISGPGRRSCTKPIARSNPRTTPGSCPTAAPSASSPRQILEGGVTYLFDNVTESLDLARRFDGLIRVQRETLDNLTEAVAVFGSNGRVQLFNPAFAKMWKLSPEALREQPHIETVEAWCKPLFDDAADLARAARGDHRDREPGRRCALKLERKDGSVLDCMTMPLPDGATMLTFQDITDTENVERALRERNEALETADQMKVDFVHHVSYELRSPLTTIIGFAHFLSRSRDRAADGRSRPNISTTSPNRPTRCWRSPTTSSISPPSTPAR